MRTGSHITKVYDQAQTPEILHYQEQLDEMAKRRQSLVIKKRGSYRYILDESTA